MATATNVSYSILDGSTSRGTVTKNGSVVAPSDGQYSGSTFSSLGIFNITTGTVTISISDGANGVVMAASWPSAGERLARLALGTGGNAAPITTDQLLSIVAEAKALWDASEIDAAQRQAIDGATVQLADLPGSSSLGLTAGNLIRVDANGAGRGWFVDPTPAINQEFRIGRTGLLKAAQGGAASGLYDLLTVVEHELGHVIGRGDINNLSHPGNLMDRDLAVGQHARPRSVNGRRVDHAEDHRGVAFGVGRGDRRSPAGPPRRWPRQVRQPPGAGTASGQRRKK